jgi:hypothetical protein
VTRYLTHRNLSLGVALGAMAAIGGALGWWYTAASVAGCHTWLGGLAQGLSTTTARDCTLAGLGHDAGALAFWAGLAVAAACAVVLHRRGWTDQAPPAAG